MKNIFIIEDDERDWGSLCDLLRGKYDYYPKTLEEFKELRGNVRLLQSANKQILESSKSDVLHLIDQYSPDLIIMDYELKEMAFNAVFVIKILEIKKIIIFFTKHLDDHKPRIEADLATLKIQYKIDVIKKPIDMQNVDESEMSKIIKILEDNMKGENEYDRLNLPVVIIMTAIQEEYMGVRQYMSYIKEENRDDTVYEKGLFVYQDKRIAKVVIRECGSGNISASQETERAIQYYNPDMILFVGIAGSRKPQDFKIGDVIIPHTIYSYEAGRSDKESFRARPDLFKMTYVIRELSKAERRKNDWNRLIHDEAQRNVKADIGIIASGEKLIEHYDSDIGKILKNHYDDTQAVEMEGFGFAKAAINQGRSKAGMIIGVIRGISDILKLNNEQEVETIKKDVEAISDRRTSGQKQFASNTAAAFAFWLIYKLNNVGDPYGAKEGDLGHPESADENR